METSLNGSEVVVVEDDLSVARLIRYALGREGARVRHAGSVAEGRKTLAQPWDLVLLDRRLPDGDGIELCREIRPHNAHGYIVILTGDATAEAKLAGFGCGADDYVTKPFLIDELVARVRAGLRIVALQKALLASNARLEELSLTRPAAEETFAEIDGAVADVEAQEGSVAITRLNGVFIDREEHPLFTTMVADFLLRSHVLGVVYPAPLPEGMEESPQQAALWCFHVFGNMALCATHEIIPIHMPEQPLRVLG